MICLLVALAIFAVCPGLGRAETVPTNHYMVQQWRMEDGLPQSFVSCLLQTRDGYLWLGSGNGVARFDGQAFTLFNSSTPSQFYHRDISSLHEGLTGDFWIYSMEGMIRMGGGRMEDLTAVAGCRRVLSYCEDRQGRMWVDCEDRVACFDRGSLRFFPAPPNWKTNAKRTILENLKGWLLIAGGNGLWRLEGERFLPLPPRPWAAGPLRDACLLGDGRLALAAGNRVWIYQDGVVTPLPGEFDPGETTIMRLRVDRRGRLWLFTSRRVCCLQDGRWVVVTAQEVNVFLGSGFCEDRQGNTWVGTSRGLYRITPGDGLTPEPVPALSKRVVTCLYLDRWDNLWVGMSDGLARVRAPRLTCYGEEDGLRCTIPRVVFQDRQGDVWIGGTGRGINRYRDGRFTFLARDRNGESLAAREVAFQDSAGRLLCVGSPLAVFRDGHFEPIRLVDGQEINMATAIVEECPGVLWVGTTAGLYRVENGRGVLFTEREGLSHACVYDLLFSRDGTLWVCTEQGVTWRRHDRFERPFVGTALAGQNVMEIYEDDTGAVWLGAYGGLYYYRKGLLKRFTTRDGLVNDDILGIAGDRFGNLWLSSLRGISRVALRELQDRAEDRTDRLHPVLFDRNDGLASVEGNGGQHPSVWRSTDGRLWFPTMGGMVVVDPARVSINTEPPPVYIEGVTADGKTMAPTPGGPVRLPAGTRRCDFHYTAVDFHNPRNVYFRYRLDGYDERWNETGAVENRVAHYMNLPPGDYVFRVKACNSDGIWNEQGATLRLTLAPLYWQTAWFKTALAAVAAIGVYLAAAFFRKYYDLVLFWRRRRRVGLYILEEIVGYGATATVFRAHRAFHPKKKAAVKILRKEHLLDENALKRFLQEAAIVDSLRHPHIVEVFERGGGEDNIYIAMEYLPGETLAARLRREGPQPPAVVRRVLLQNAEALTALHRQGIMHRDLKPANFMLLEQDGHRDFVKLLDFGLARTQLHSRFTVVGGLSGTMAYLAPERAAGHEDTPAADIYALGVIAYEMLTGRTPFGGKDEIEMLRDILVTPVPSVSVSRPDAPLDLAELVRAMTRRDPATRPTAPEICQRLKSMAELAPDYEQTGTTIQPDMNNRS